MNDGSKIHVSRREAEQIFAQGNRASHCRSKKTRIRARDLLFALLFPDSLEAINVPSMVDAFIAGSITCIVFIFRPQRGPFCWVYAPPDAHGQCSGTSFRNLKERWVDHLEPTSGQSSQCKTQSGTDANLRLQLLKATTHLDFYRKILSVGPADF